MFREIGNERAFDGILNQIIENIQNGSLKAGAALPAERTMAETMGVSRPAVREVLRALELLGIVKPVDLYKRQGLNCTSCLFYMDFITMAM